VRGDLVPSAIAATRATPYADVPPQPDQSVLEQILASLTVAA
jgi:hypothetical protein